MVRIFFLSVCSCCFLLAACVMPVRAENAGQEDLDKAVQLKIAAETPEDLGEVIDHVDTALEKGLDKENTKLAKQLLESALLQRGQAFAAAIFNVPAQESQ